MKISREYIERTTLLVSTTVILIAITIQRGHVVDSLQALYARAGLATFILVPLTMALIAAVINAWITSNWDSAVTRKTLRIAVILGPMTGFLGTTLGLMQAINALGQARSLDRLLEMVGHTFEGMAIAFSTTVWGLILAIVATLVLEILGDVPSTDINKPCPTPKVQSETEDSNEAPNDWRD